MRQTFFKILAISVLIILFCHGNAYAEKKLNFGIKAGYNFSSHWSTQEKVDDSSVIIRSEFGLVAGVLANFRLSNFFRLQPEILYIQKGSKQDVAIPGVPFGTIFVIYDLDYLEIPIVLKFYPKKGKGLFQPVLSTGPYLSFLLKSAYSTSHPLIDKMEYDIEGLKKIDMGFLSGWESNSMRKRSFSASTFDIRWVLLTWICRDRTQCPNCSLKKL